MNNIRKEIEEKCYELIELGMDYYDRDEDGNYWVEGKDDFIEWLFENYNVSPKKKRGKK